MAKRTRRPKHSCIYMISCLSNGKVYVGSSKDTAMRWNSHIWELLNWKHSNGQLLVDWKRYGFECFTFSILELLEDVKEIRKREQYWIDKMKKEGKNLYNLRKA